MSHEPCRGINEKTKNFVRIPGEPRIRNTVGMGDSEELLQAIPAESVDLVFTSPPYFNARPEYAEYAEYEEYLLKMRKIFCLCHRALSEGSFFVINASPVLVRRTCRSKSSKRLAIPFDFHRICTEEGFDFIDDVIWRKPNGAGWASGRGRRFAADRNPLQYKPAPVTEYVLVYRKHSNRLIDWHIRKRPKDIVAASKIKDGYEKTNIWNISPARSSKHPAVFPEELAAKVIQYYSFKEDVVLDPFAGIGTTAKAAYKNNRGFICFEIQPEYIETFKQDMSNWFPEDPQCVNWINCASSTITNDSLLSP